MRVIGKLAILKFAEWHPDTLAPLMIWYRIPKEPTGALWPRCARTSRMRIVGRRTVFNIHGIRYRLIARVNYKTQRVFILHILTHVEYSKGGWKR